jgi:hypothetical protein
VALPELPYARRRVLVPWEHVAPGAALHREAGTGAHVTHGDPGATLSREVGTTPPPPLLHPFVGGPGVVVHVTPPDNPH